MKKIITLLAVAALIVCLVGCGKKQPTGAALLEEVSGTPAPTAQEESAPSVPLPASEAAAGKEPVAVPTPTKTPQATAAPAEVKTPATGDLPLVPLLLTGAGVLILCAVLIRRRTI